LPSIANSGFGRPARLSGQKRVPRPPAIISAAALDLAAGVALTSRPTGPLADGLPADSFVAAGVVSDDLPELALVRESFAAIGLPADALPADGLAAAGGGRRVETARIKAMRRVL